jgi:hypothetical protein
MEHDNLVAHAMEVLGDKVFFDIVGVCGLCLLAKTCKMFRHIQLRKDAVLSAIQAATRQRKNLTCRLALFGMMPRAIMTGNSRRAMVLLRTARAYERNLVQNRRMRFPNFYAYAYYNGICGNRGNRVHVWKEVAEILCEMENNGEAVELFDKGSAPWGRKSFRWRRNNARHFLGFYTKGHKAQHKMHTSLNLNSKRSY